MRPSSPWSNDLVLGALAQLPPPFGTLVAAFPGRSALPSQPNWIDKWFADLADSYANGTPPPNPKIQFESAAASGADLSLLAKTPVSSSVRVQGVRCNYFRGFRQSHGTIDTRESLIVVEGLNSSGKTSLAEAIEWTISGSLSRRSGGSSGHPRELANCISNVFRPDSSETWVELDLLVNGKTRTLRRTLTRDYTAQASSTAGSTLSINNHSLSETAERQILERLFAGVTPVLMQHSLRQFVHDNPTSRRQYFERLLQIDELTELISRSVVGDARMQQIASTKAEVALPALEGLAAAIKNQEVSLRLREVTAKSPADGAAADFLVEAARKAFPDIVQAGLDIGNCETALRSAQLGAKEKALPLLSTLRSNAHLQAPDIGPLRQALKELRDNEAKLKAAEAAAANLGLAERCLARCISELEQAGLVETSSSTAQECPLCETADSLTSDRLQDIASWKPAAAALDSARAIVQKQRSKVQQTTASLRTSVSDLLLELPSDADLTALLEKRGETVRKAATAAIDAARSLNEQCQELRREVDIDPESNTADESLNRVSAAREQHRSSTLALEEAMTAALREDPRFALRDKWLKAASCISKLPEEQSWRSACQSAQSHLADIRQGLIDLRSEIIEDARERFSGKFNEVWSALRKGGGAKFSELQIPKPRGRGFQLELEVKASVSDGTTPKIVDALRVFSESQVNVVGIAAYVTRAELLGHRLLIFDDPVQSMDQDHFKTFAKDLVDELLARGNQVLIMTHSDDFARRISYFQAARSEFASVMARYGRNTGCRIEEGSRRVSERLKQAESHKNAGDLELAWRMIRLAIERLYTLIRMSTPPKFDAESWRNASAEDMWNQGVSDAIEQHMPEAGDELKRALVGTAAGAHDKGAGSESEVVEAIELVRSVQRKMKCGD